MSSRRQGRQGALAALCLFCTCGVTRADSSDDTWLLTAGTELDEEDGYLLELGLAWVPSATTSIGAYAGTADTLTDFNDFTSRMASLGFDHAFDHFGFTLEARWWGDAELFESTAAAGTLYYKSKGWRVSLSGELRESDFEPFDFDVTIPIRGTPVPVSGSAACGLDNSGYGASLSHTGKTWSVLLAGMQYDYSATDCELTALNVPPQVGTPPPITREIVQRIASAVLTRGAELLGSELTRENGFLDYSLWASLGYQSGLKYFALDYFHDREEFEGLLADTLIGSITFPISSRLDLELRIGATDSDLSGTIAFAGVTVFAFLGK
jgi:hypothetical protein